MIGKTNTQLIVAGFILSYAVTVTTATNMAEELKITQEQKAKINKLRQLVLPYITEAFMKDDLHLVRMLRATKFDIMAAKRRVMENIQWRKENKISNILNEDFSDISEDYPYIFTVDKQQQPTFIGFAGDWDVRGAVVTGRAKRVIRYINQAMESAVRRIRELQLEGRNVTRLNLIIDLDGFNLVTHGCVSCLFRILDFLLLYDNNYTGLADHIIFTNSPPTIAAAADMVKANANSVTWDAIKVYTHDRNTWRKALFSIFSRDQLPMELGGTKPRSFFPNILK